ncbi:MAG: hypothetical protein FOGNACKC_00764 [Anaerolineae bacterium]|nr:hypothetical protein [Anaerolineae bacterium]
MKAVNLSQRKDLRNKLIEAFHRARVYADGHGYAEVSYPNDFTPTDDLVPQFVEVVWVVGMVTTAVKLMPGKLRLDIEVPDEPGTTRGVEGDARWQDKWDVASFSTPGKKYRVSRSACGQWGCTCPRWIYRRAECGHIRHVKKLVGTGEKVVRDVVSPLL